MGFEVVNFVATTRRCNDRGNTRDAGDATPAKVHLNAGTVCACSRSFQNEKGIQICKYGAVTRWPIANPRLKFMKNPPLFQCLGVLLDELTATGPCRGGFFITKARFNEINEELLP